MNITVCKSKIHRARLTQCDLHYEGSIAVDSDIMDAAGIFPYEKVLVVNATCGSRLETYVIPAPRGSRMFCLNGAAARLGEKGDIVTLMTFGMCHEDEAFSFEPKIVVMNENNEIVERKGRITF